MAMRFSKLVPYALAGWLPGGRRECVVCGHNIWRYMPYRDGSRSVTPLMHALDVIGSDVDNFECPRCGAHDRERHLVLFTRACGLLEKMKDASILHFAPERHFSKILSTLSDNYVPCDLYPKGDNAIRVDMENIEFPAESFDFVIANHVLEHVRNIDLALSELFRVLKPRGYAILQTPYSAKLHHTWSDEGIDTAVARLQAHGQEDHLRLFGMDVFATICRAGFVSHVKTHADVLNDVDSISSGVNIREPFFLFSK